MKSENQDRSEKRLKIQNNSRKEQQKTKDKINKKLEKMKKFRSCESCPVDKGNFDMVQ